MAWLAPSLASQQRAILLGIAGSFAGGFVWNLIEYDRFASHKFHTADVVGSIIGAIGVLVLVRLTGAERSRRASRTR